MSARKPPGAIDGKAVVFAFFAATVYFSCALRKNSSTSSRGSASSSSSSSGKKTSALETEMMRKRDGTCRATDDDDWRIKEKMHEESIVFVRVLVFPPPSLKRWCRCCARKRIKGRRQR